MNKYAFTTGIVIGAVVLGSVTFDTIANAEIVHPVPTITATPTPVPTPTTIKPTTPTTHVDADMWDCVKTYENRGIDPLPVCKDIFSRLTQAQLNALFDNTDTDTQLDTK